MPVNSTHSGYDAMLPAWLRARDVIAGEDAVKDRGERYLPRLEGQMDNEYAAYKARAAFFNATARTADGYAGLIFRRTPFVKLPEAGSALGRALVDFQNDADMLGTSLVAYAKNVLSKVIVVGRAGSLIDWESENENRVYASLYCAENILNWRVERINGRNIPTLVVLYEPQGGMAGGKDEFEAQGSEQIRVLRLQRTAGNDQTAQYHCVVEFQITRLRAGLFSHPCRTGTNPQIRTLLEPTHPGCRQRGE